MRTRRGRTGGLPVQPAGASGVGTAKARLRVTRPARPGAVAACLEPTTFSPQRAGAVPDQSSWAVCHGAEQCRGREPPRPASGPPVKMDV